MPNFKSISFKTAVLQRGGQNLPSPCVCYPKDPMWDRVKGPLIHNGREGAGREIKHFQYNFVAQLNIVKWFRSSAFKT